MPEQFTRSPPLATGLSPISTPSSTGEADKAKHLKYAYERADRILRFYRRTDAWDPDVFLAGIAANLAEYPKDIIDEVADPVKGIASKCTFPPQPSEVRKACEDIAEPRRKRAAREASIKKQLDERQQLEAPHEERQSWEQVQEELAAKGFGVSKANPETVQSVRQKLGLTQEQWDAIPNAPKSGSEYWLGIRDCAPPIDLDQMAKG